jgi:DAK2 domain fusion protein YloV
MVDRVLDGTVFKELILSSQRYLFERKKEVDALNVFPVPDGDTGTNMYLTLTSAASYLAGKDDLPLCEAAEMASQGALMGARGNSGVILSQIFRGVSRYFAGRDGVPASEVGRALDEAVSTAYKAVMKPVEGTILTVLRAMRDGAGEVADANATLGGVLAVALMRGKEILARTPDMLPVLRQAGVVDAGGKGLVYIVEGALSALQGEAVEEPAAAGSATGSKPWTARLEGLETSDIKFPYDTQLLVSGERIPLAGLRAGLEDLGDCLLVVGSESLVRVHIHTSRPGDVLTACTVFGMLSQVTVDNMVEQTRQASETYLLSPAAMGEESALPVPAVNSSPAPAVMPGPAPQAYAGASASPGQKETGIVSVATGDGMKAIMASLGCDLVLDGGSTMNPSTAELAEAVKTVGARKIIFFPNNGNIFLAAKQAKKLVGRNMYIVPSKSLPQGISALLSLNLSEDMTHNLKRASKALRRVTTGEVTFAARDGRVGRQAMKRGDILGLIDGKVEMVGADPSEVLIGLVERMVRSDDEIVTIYYGQDVSPEAGTAAVARLEDALGDEVEIEIHDGGQPLYYYIVSVE